MEENKDVNNETETSQVSEKKELRKLGSKNTRAFVILAVLSVLIFLVFFFGIRRVSGYDSKEYDVLAGTYMYDDYYELFTTDNDGTLRQSFNGKYYLSSDSKKYEIGKVAIGYNPKDTKMQLYGTLYQVNVDSSVKKITKFNEVSKGSDSYFYKISDRKYLWIDSSFESVDGSINTKDYLIIELDTLGNAHFANYELNVNTINPIIVKGSKYQFDCANELLLIGGNQINLKNIIGSSNLYTNEEEELADKDDKSQTIVDYYNSYMKEIANRFNKIYSNMNDTNKTIRDNEAKSNSDINITRWVALTGVTSTVNTIKINYAVFDPNTEYDAIYVTITGPNNYEQTYYLSKEKSEYIIRELLPSSEYTVEFGYKLAASLDPTGTLVSDDVVKIQTTLPVYELKFTKVKSNKLYFYLKMDTDYQADEAKIVLYSDNTKLAEKNVDIEQAKYGYQDSFDFTSLGSMITLKLEDVYYNGELVNLDCYSKFVNR